MKQKLETTTNPRVDFFKRYFLGVHCHFSNQLGKFAFYYPNTISLKKYIWFRISPCTSISNTDLIKILSKIYLRKHRKEELDKKSLPSWKPGLLLEYLKSYWVLFLGILLPSWYHISHDIFTLMSLISHIPYCEKLFESSVFDDPAVLHLGALPVYCALPCCRRFRGVPVFCWCKLTDLPAFLLYGADGKALKTQLRWRPTSLAAGSQEKPRDFCALILALSRHCGTSRGTSYLAT